MRLSGSVLRVCAFLLAGAMGVHELRYASGVGGEAARTLAGHGHGYLVVAGPVIGLLSAWVLGHLLVSAASRVPSASPAGRRLGVLWPAASAALLGIYVSQELVEGLIAPGHAGGWEGVFGAGGLIAVPLAIAFGLIVACVLRVARLVASTAHALAVGVPRARDESRPGFSRAARIVLACGRVLADHAAGRGPPVSISV